MGEERRYDEREVGLILKRVAELHGREGERADHRSMSTSEIEEVVGELGISKALVARAASEVSLQDVRNRPVWWLGGKTDFMFEEVVDGRVDDATLTRMIELLRRQLGDPGELRTEGASRIWSTKQAEGNRWVYFSVVEQGERTTLRLEERAPVDARVAVGGGTVGGGFTGLMTVVPLKALLVKSVLMLALGPIVLVGATLGWLGGRAYWARQSARRDDQLRRVFAEIITIAREPKPALALVAASGDS